MSPSAHRSAAASTATSTPTPTWPALDDLAKLGVTWAGVSVPGGSLSQSLEGLERYGTSVIAPSRS